MTRILAVDIDVARTPACRAYLAPGLWIPLTLRRYLQARRALSRRRQGRI